MECVEGDWKHFEFKKIQISDLTVVLPHLRREFYLDEPLCQLVGISDERIEDLHRIVTAVVADDGLSFFVLHKETKKVAAVQIIDFKADSAPVRPVNSNQSKIVRKYLTALYDGVNICRDYNVPVAVELFITSVAREFRGQGLVHEMYSRAIQMCKILNYSVISGSFTHPGTRRSAMKHEFQEIQRRLFSDHKDEKTSECLFLEIPKADEYAAVMVLKIT